MNHDIIVKFVPEVKNEHYPEMLSNIRDLFENLRGMSGIHDIRLYPNVIDRENRFDLMIEIEMEKEALEAYDRSVWHRQWKEQYGPFVAQKTIIDRL